MHYLRVGGFVAASALGVYGSRYGALLMGLGDVAGTNRVIAVTQSVQILVSALLVISGAGLVGLAAGALVGAVGTTSWNRHRLSRAMGPSRGRFSSAFLRGMLPSTLRLGTVIFGAYLINQANTLVTARFLGAAATASYGLSLQGVALLSAGSFVFLYTKTPTFALMRQQGDLAGIRLAFVAAMRRSLALYLAAGAAMLFAAPPLLRLIGSRVELVPTSQLLVLLVVRLLEAHHSAFATLIITENDVPFVVPALASGVAIVGLSILLVPIFGMWAIVGVPGIVQLAWNNWWTVLRGLRGISMSARQYGGLMLARP